MAAGGSYSMEGGLYWPHVPRRGSAHEHSAGLLCSSRDIQEGQGLFAQARGWSGRCLLHDHVGDGSCIKSHCCNAHKSDKGHDPPGQQQIRVDS
jgi:hypothetical protein